MHPPATPPLTPQVCQLLLPVPFRLVPQLQGQQELHLATRPVKPQGAPSARPASAPTSRPSGEPSCSPSAEPYGDPSGFLQLSAIRSSVEPPFVMSFALRYNL